MKRSFLFTGAACIAISAVAVPAHALPSLPKPAMPGASKGGGEGAKVSAADIDTFLATAWEAQALVGQASIRIMIAVGNKEQADKIRAGLDAASKIQDPKEKDAAVRKIQADATTQAAKLDFAAGEKALAAENNATKNKQIGIAIFNLALGLLKDKDLIEQGSALMKGISANPMEAARMGSRIGLFKEAFSSIGEQVKATPQIMGGLHKLMNVAKVERLPASSADKPKVNEGGL